MNYKNYTTKSLGFSDIAQVTLRYFSEDEKKVCYANVLFGGDGSYDAYIVDEKAEIGEHYTEVLALKNVAWLDVIDDSEVTLKIIRHQDEVKFFRAGSYGCIIQTIGR